MSMYIAPIVEKGWNRKMAKIIIENKVQIEWDNVPQDVVKAVETLLYAIEENQEIDMVSHIGEQLESEEVNDSKAVNK